MGFSGFCVCVLSLKFLLAHRLCAFFIHLISIALKHEYANEWRPNSSLHKQSKHSDITLKLCMVWDAFILSTLSFYWSFITHSHRQSFHILIANTMASMTKFDFASHFFFSFKCAHQFNFFNPVTFFCLNEKLIISNLYIWSLFFPAEIIKSVTFINGN